MCKVNHIQKSAELGFKPHSIVCRDYSVTFFCATFCRLKGRLWTL